MDAHVASFRPGQPGLLRVGQLLLALALVTVLAGMAVLVHRGERVPKSTLLGAITVSLMLISNGWLLRQPRQSARVHRLVKILLALLLIASASLWLSSILS